MGGLVARSYIELSSDPLSSYFKLIPPVAEVDKLITMATPHWGGAGIAYLGNLDPMTARKMLSPGHCVYEGCSINGDKIGFLEHINKGDNKTKYYALIGAPIHIRIKSIPLPFISEEVTRSFFKKNTSSIIWSPKDGSDYEDQALKFITSYVAKHLDYNPSTTTFSVQIRTEYEWRNPPTYNSDGWVTLNSGLGYKYKVWSPNIEINMEEKLIFFGLESQVWHNGIYKYKDALNKVLEWLQ